MACFYGDIAFSLGVEESKSIDNFTSPMFTLVTFSLG